VDGSTTVTYDGQAILALPNASAAAYYAEGLILSTTDGHLDRASWRPGQAAELGVSITLRAQEFIYAFSSHQGKFQAATNHGRVLEFASSVDDPVIFYDHLGDQFYATINYNGDLFFGDYPAGVLYRLDQSNLVQLAAFPPRPAAANERVREAQTALIHAGGLVVGVWPWGELWQYDGSFWTCTRMFTAPAITRVQAPYDNEMRTLPTTVDVDDAIHNLWGQRIVAMLPYQDGFVVATANKTGFAGPLALYSFVQNTEEYGRVYLIKTRPALAAEITWAPKSKLEFLATADRLAIYQDGKRVAETDATVSGLREPKVTTSEFGAGAYGPFNGSISHLNLQWSE
jgi:hypothetical protein